MKEMTLPKMSTAKPSKSKFSIDEVGVCTNLLAQQFNQPAPNLVWVCDFIYIRVYTQFYYLCVILDPVRPHSRNYDLSPNQNEKSECRNENRSNPNPEFSYS